jgi:hypothetical protein
VGFWIVVKRWLKTKWSILKVRHFARKKDCLVNIELAHWESLKVYWSKPKTKKNVDKCAILGAK